MITYLYIGMFFAGLLLSLILAGYLYGKWRDKWDEEPGNVTFMDAKRIVDEKKDSWRDDEDGPDVETAKEKMDRRNKRI